MAVSAGDTKYGTLCESDESIQEKPKGCCERLYPSGFKQEFKEIVKLTVPMVLTQLSQYMIGPVALMFCGHLGKTELAAVALATSFINLTGVSVAVGLACACDTLFAQVFGSVNRKRLGVELQRSLLILLLALLPCWAIHLNMEAVLLLFGQDPFISRKAAQYMFVFMPGMLFFFIYVCLSKYLQNQNITIPNLLIGGIANGINALCHYLLVMLAELDIVGSAISQVLTYFSMMGLTLLYIVGTGVYKDTWQGWSMDCLRDWGQFMRLAAFGIIMIMVEYGSFEVGVVTAGLLSTTYLGAMSVIFQLETFAYMLPLGTGIAASIRVGQFLGAGDAAGAQTSARVTMTSICFVELFVALIFITLRNYLPLIFTNVPEVVDLVRDVLYICAVYQISDGLAGTGGGILRGQGRQHLGAAIIFAGFAGALVVGTPLMLYTSLRLFAFWGGLAIALTIEGVLFAVIIHFNDWEEQAREALVRAKVPESKILELSSSGREKDSLLRSRSLERKDSKVQMDDDQVEECSSKPFPREILRLRILTLILTLGVLIGGILLRLLYTEHLQLPPDVLEAPGAGNITLTWTHVKI